jgi:hypothetical protein
MPIGLNNTVHILKEIAILGAKRMQQTYAQQEICPTEVNTTGIMC